MGAARGEGVGRGGSGCCHIARLHFRFLSLPPDRRTRHMTARAPRASIPARQRGRASPGTAILPRLFSTSLQRKLSSGPGPAAICPPPALKRPCSSAFPPAQRADHCVLRPVREKAPLTAVVRQCPEPEGGTGPWGSC